MSTPRHININVYTHIEIIIIVRQSHEKCIQLTRNTMNEEITLTTQLFQFVVVPGKQLVHSNMYRIERCKHILENRFSWRILKARIE